MTHCPECGVIIDDTPRSHASHAGYFAELHELYLTMPEAVTERLPNFEMFRKFCLIKTGWRDEAVYPCDTRHDALSLAAVCRNIGDFSIVHIDADNTVTRWTAKSQSYKAMGKVAFKQSRDDVEAYARMLLEERKAA